MAEEYSNRDFWERKVKPVLKKRKLSGIKYDEAKQDIFDEVMVKCVKEGKLYTRGWIGLSPEAVRAGDADNPERIVNTLEIIRKGKLPMAAFQYMLSPAHQHRIRAGVAKPVAKMVGNEELKTDKAKETTGLFSDEFDRNAEVEAGVRKTRRTEEKDDDIQRRVDEALAKNSRPELDHELGLVDEHGKPISSKDLH